MVSKCYADALHDFISVVTQLLLQGLFHDFTIHFRIKQFIDFLTLISMASINPTIFHDTCISVFKIFNTNSMFDIQPMKLAW